MERNGNTAVAYISLTGHSESLAGTLDGDFVARKPPDFRPEIFTHLRIGFDGLRQIFRLASQDLTSFANYDRMILCGPGRTIVTNTLARPFTATASLVNASEDTDKAENTLGHLLIDIGHQPESQPRSVS